MPLSAVIRTGCNANKKLRLPGADDIHNVIFVEQAENKKSKRDERLSWVKYP